ncbi:MAG: hypothetical protein ABEJ68_02755 [Halobacteriaceae archaeon]
MGLSDIAAGIETTTEQQARGVASVDRTDRSLADRLRDVAEALPCTPEAAATVARTYAGGASVGESADEAGVVPVTAAKALHLLGVEGVTPLSPTEREILRDWLSADLSRTDALSLTGASETEFALGAFVETHDPIPEAREAVNETLAPAESMASKRDRLAGAVGDPEDVL